MGCLFLQSIFPFFPFRVMESFNASEITFKLCNCLWSSSWTVRRRLTHFLKVSCYLCIQFCVSSSALSDMFYHNRTLFYIQGTVLKSRSLNGKRRTLDPRGKLNPEMGRGSLQNVQKKRVYLLTKKIHPYGQIPQNWEHWVADFPYHVFFSQELLYRKKITPYILFACIKIRMRHLRRYEIIY